MQTYKKLLTPWVLVPSLFLCAIFVFASGYLFPAFFGNATGGAAFGRYLLGLGVLLALIAGAFALLTVLLRKSAEALGVSQPALKLSKYVGKLLLLLLVFAGAALVLSVIDGFIATLLYAWLHVFLTLDQIKSVVDIVTNVISVLVLPLFLLALLSFGLEKPAVVGSVKGGLRRFKAQYLKILAVLLVLVGTGYLVLTLFNFAGASAVLEILQAVILSAFGAAGVLLMVTVYAACSGRKTEERLAHEKKAKAAEKSPTGKKAKPTAPAGARKVSADKG